MNYNHIKPVALSLAIKTKHLSTRFGHLVHIRYLIHIGDGFHAFMVFERSKQEKENFIMVFKENCIQFDIMNLRDIFLYIFTIGGWLINQVSKCIYVILSVKRNAPLWNIYKRVQCKGEHILEDVRLLYVYTLLIFLVALCM